MMPSGNSNNLSTNLLLFPELVIKGNMFLSCFYTKRHEVGTKIHEETTNVMEFDQMSGTIIGCAIDVHKLLGPGLLESAYEECMVYELLAKGLVVERQKPIPVIYKDIRLDYGYRLDLLVENLVIVELKSIDSISPVHEAQILTYMRFSKIKTGLLINFNVALLKKGIIRRVL